MGIRSLLVALVLALAVPVGAASGARPALPSGVSTSSTTGGVGSTTGARPALSSGVSTSSTAGLAGRVVVIDPGHQLGNYRFPRKVNRLVPAGGFKKPCNTTGTATNGGYAEATFVWRVAKRLQRRLVERGARVVLTRKVNSVKRWGPCVDRRGRAGNRIDADLKISIHADGSYASGARGFHVIAPTDRKPWTHDIYRPSKRLAKTVKAGLRSRGFRVANYIAGGDGLDFRSDLGTLNLSDVPTVMVELGNMRNAAEAKVMTRPKGQRRYARALARGVRGFLGE